MEFLLKELLNLSLDAVSKGIDLDETKNYLQKDPTILEVHDLHIWEMSTTEVALTVHIVRSKTEDHDIFLQTLAEELHDNFGIEHTTIQIEKGTFCCSPASEETIQRKIIMHIVHKMFNIKTIKLEN